VIAPDTSVLVDYLSGRDGPRSTALDEGLARGLVVLAPVVLTEILCARGLSTRAEGLLLALPLLEVTEGYWERAGKLRARLLQKKLKARIADTLIVQSAIDHDATLLTNDTDFRHFAKYGGLRLA
jgi:predicted nucleic acid-binding protein